MQAREILERIRGTPDIGVEFDDIKMAAEIAYSVHVCISCACSLQLNAVGDSPAVVIIIRFHDPKTHTVAHFLGDDLQ